MTVSIKNSTANYEVGTQASAGPLYRTDTGREPVREWLKGLDPEDRKVVGEDINDVEFLWLSACRS